MRLGERPLAFSSGEREEARALIKLSHRNGSLTIFEIAVFT